MSFRSCYVVATTTNSEHNDNPTSRVSARTETTRSKCACVVAEAQGLADGRCSLHQRTAVSAHFHSQRVLRRVSPGEAGTLLQAPSAAFRFPKHYSLVQRAAPCRAKHDAVPLPRPAREKGLPSGH